MVRKSNPASYRSVDKTAAPNLGLRRACVLVTDVDVDLWRARGVDLTGRPCFADRRSDVSISALHEGERWRVLLTPEGLIKSLSAPMTPHRGSSHRQVRRP